VRDFERLPPRARRKIFDLIKNGSLPVSVIEWILLDDPAAVQQATK
jgi:hypothetical protein